MSTLVIFLRQTSGIGWNAVFDRPYDYGLVVPLWEVGGGVGAGAGYYESVPATRLGIDFRQVMQPSLR